MKALFIIYLCIWSCLVLFVSIFFILLQMPLFFFYFGDHILFPLTLSQLQSLGSLSLLRLACFVCTYAIITVQIWASQTFHWPCVCVCERGRRSCRFWWFYETKWYLFLSYCSSWSLQRFSSHLVPPSRRHTMLKSHRLHFQFKSLLSLYNRQGKV